MTTRTSRAGLGLLLGGAFAAAVALAAPAPPVPDTGEFKERKEFIPNRKYQSLPGTTVGVLVGDVQGMMGQEGRSGPPDAMGFSAAGGSYRWVYVPADGAAIIQNLNVRVGEKGDKTVIFPALNMANPETVKQWDIKAPCALVEVDVNNTQGAPADEAFVGTRMKRLDGTKDFPVVVADAVADARKRYDAYVKDQQKAIDAALDEEQKSALKDRKPTGPRETITLFYVTWLPDTEHLSIRFRTTITDGAFQYGGGAPPAKGPFPLPPPPPLPDKPVQDRPAPAAGPRLPPPPPPPNFPAVRFGTAFGVEFGAAYEVSKAGKVDRILSLPIQGFQRELPPPAGVGPRVPVDPLPPRPLDREPVDK